MKKSVEYSDLERHYIAPSNISPFYNFKRIPRKMKKKLKDFDYILKGQQYSFLDINQKLWFILGFTNPDYKRFLIKKITQQNR